MAGYRRIIVIVAMQFVIASVSSIYYANHKYDHESEFTNDQEEHKNGHNRFSLFDPNNINPSANHVPSQLRSPLSKDSSADNLELETQGAESKLSIIDDHRRFYTEDVKGKRSYENFVTPKGESFMKGYEVTTKKFVDTEPETALAPSALGRDNDVAIALDDEDIDHEDEPETSRPEHLNPLVYLDSYGRLHGEGQSPRGSSQGFGYGVVHSRTPPHHLYSKKSTGRVRVQVFRGPTRIVGHKKYAPWGYYVVQPASSYGPHHYPGPPYYYR